MTSALWKTNLRIKELIIIWKKSQLKKILWIKNLTFSIKITRRRNHIQMKINPLISKS